MHVCKKFAKYLFVIIITSWFWLTNCMLELEGLLAGITESDVIKVEAAIEYGEDVNENLCYNPMVHSTDTYDMILPLVLAIKYLEKAENEEDLEDRFKIITVLIDAKAKINKEVFKAVDELKYPDIKFRINELLIKKESDDVVVLDHMSEEDVSEDDFVVVDTEREEDIDKKDVPDEKGIEDDKLNEEIFFTLITYSYRVPERDKMFKDKF